MTSPFLAAPPERWIASNDLGLARIGCPGHMGGIVREVCVLQPEPNRGNMVARRQAGPHPQPLRGIPLSRSKQ